METFLERPLAGLLVIALEQAVAAPLATRHLADLGARVIKIERPGVGDFARHYDQSVHGMSSHFVWLNRSKESLALDLKHPQGMVVLERLLAKADVLVQNLAPGALDRLGFAPVNLLERFPRLIACSICGYGADGPYRDKKAYDLLVQAESGFLSITGIEELPVKAGISIADIAAGMYAFSGIMTALYRRQQTGVGATLEVSMLEALGEWMGYPAYYTSYGGQAPGRSGAHHATISPYGPFVMQDERVLLIGIQNEREWVAFCEQVLHQPGLAHDPRFCTNTQRVQHRATLEALVQEVLASMTIQQAMDCLERAQIAYGQMRSMQEFLEHPQLAARQRWSTVDSPVGPLWALHPPGLPDGTVPVFNAIPKIGQHTEAILREIGFDDEQNAAGCKQGMPD
jgi:crotonobetainyl-CoA:carnitine CoA-transferase CaiB-like acyl-CoA transferase